MTTTCLDWAHVLLEDMDRARSLTVAILLRNNEWDQLVDLNCDPSGYPDYSGENFRLDYQATELFRKIQDAPTSHDRVANAKKAWYEAEELCHETNFRMKQIAYYMEKGLFHNGTPSWLPDFIKEWRHQIKKILGNIPEEIVFRFSSGSTFDDRFFITPMDKMSNRPTITEDAIDVVIPFWNQTLWKQSLVDEFPHRSSPRIVRGDRFTAVPKTAKTDRGICVGPSLLTTAQLGVGRFIRKRLRRVGIDLKFGQDHHRTTVALASLTKALGTIDLSSASDTVSRELVRLVLPPMWYDLLDALRTKETRIDKRWIKIAKFSAMGNGFTFELETLLFYTLALTVAQRAKVDASSISVYGDDIIAPVEICTELCAALRFFGFKTNAKKTFINDVPFRESCGEDFFNGIPVRGYHLEKIPNQPIEWIKLANGIRRMARHYLSRYGDLDRYTRSWIRVVDHIPKNYRCFGPVHYGDLAIHDCDASRWTTRTNEYVTSIRILQPIFGDECYSRVDRRCWSRGSILAAASDGLLKGAGLIHKNDGRGRTTVTDGKFILPRSEAVGYIAKWIPLAVAPMDRKVVEALDRFLKGNNRALHVNVR